ncbi:lipid II:glycine glycyltransferase FemX [Actinacidiphila sp. bgisy144]|uniref:lipid II:glycine glycyltransferase FemX n=1 Tax=unclassified Actinacidiphila TaxID=2995708 RepID=UPI003EBF99E5
MASTTYTVAPISTRRHLEFVAARGGASHTQMPSWGGVKPDWRAESLGWSDAAGQLVGAGLVLYRPLPGVRRSLAYLPEGPVIDWHAADLDRWLAPLVAHCRAQGAFAVRVGPRVEARTWDAAAVKAAIADPGITRLGQAAPTWQDPRAGEVAARLRAARWRPARTGADGFGAGQPRFVWRLPVADRAPQDLLRGFSQQWRRNVRKAENAGVKVVRGDAGDLPEFHRLYVGTAARDGFLPRPLPYFRRMWDALTAEHPDRMRLYLAAHDGDVLAAATMLTVGGHVWYSYGASAVLRREVQPNNAIQWQMIRDACELGASVYDFRGITDTVDPDDPHVGLLRFKSGAGGEACENLGEWDFPVNRVLHRALDAYLSRR